ncbi:MAG TPA: hypothetical protein VKW76_06410 [Candidatus Binatia bacterium]|nr:hypothetical protein [Candidatus Binatia bacterium]
MPAMPLLSALLALVISAVLIPGTGEALTSCQVHVSARNGTIDVFAKGVSGPLLWGNRPGGESNTFANAATCISGTSASKCELGPPASLQAITPPDVCTLYLKDDGAECAAYVKGCTPGPRFSDQAKADALQQLVGAISFHHSVPTIEFSGVNVQIDSGSGATDGPVNGSGNLIIGYDANAGACFFDQRSCATDADCIADVCAAGFCSLSPPTPCFQDADCPPNPCNITSLKTGSHNLVVGDGHTYTSFGGLVAGSHNAVTGPAASVGGGAGNRASGIGASVSGGSNVTAGAADEWHAGQTGGFPTGIEY